MRGSTQRTFGLAVLLLSLGVAFLGATGAASGRQSAVRTVRYRGYVVTIPRSWPVYYLARDPRRCVRFDRHALYLGAPTAAQRCPAHLAGRTEAILIAPLSKAPRAQRQAALPNLDGHATTFAAGAVRVTATWANAKSLIMRALHRRSLPSAQPRTQPPPRAYGPRAIAPRAARSASTVYNGLGFDACSTPSQTQMSAWASSPYRAIGVYIGGINAACAQPNLTSSWVSTEVAAGWHLIPTYVGLQAPSNSCGCAGITPSQASAQGAAAANDAASDAAAVGLPPGNPIYDDMEGYSRTSTNTQAVLAFLSAWTSQLHADGYASGVYSSALSGIADLVAEQGTGYVEPDDIWIADWNGQQTTSDPSVPASDWSNQQRLHQYRGAHNETYGGVTINIDNDYLDGATADTTSGTITSALPPTPPTVALTPLPDGRTDVDASWSGAVGVSAWRVLAGFDSTGAALTPIAQAAAKTSSTRIVVRNGSPYFAIQALGSSGQVLGTSAPTALPPHLTLLGPRSFAPAKGGLSALPVGCYTGAPCHIKLTLRAGRTLIASTGSEYVGSTTAGLLYYRLNAKGRTLLARAPRNRLAVAATVRDTSGAGATLKLNLIAVSTSGRTPAHRAVQAATIRVVNAFDYVSPGGVGGTLVACRNVAVCHITTTLKARNVVIAHPRPQYLGANELGYMSFALTARGRRLLLKARGNQLGAQLTLTNAGMSTTTRIVLVGYS